jgi:hypothetical protein
LVWKKVNNADAGTSTKFGGNDLDKVSDLFSGVDVDDVDINSDFTTRSGKRKLRNPANTFDYIEATSAIVADRTVTEPLLTGDDTRVYQAHSQALTNKTIDLDLNTLPHFETAAYYTVYIAGSTVKCRDNILGTIVSSSATNPEIPIQFAIDNGIGKRVYVANGSYNLNAAFTGFNIDVDSADMHLYLDPRAILNVPSGYSGSVIIFNDGASLTTVEGGRINDPGLTRAYTGIYMHNTGATTAGVNSCKVYNMYIRNANRGIYLHTEGVAPKGWINGNTFRDIFIDRTITHIEFNQVAGSFGINRNSFFNLGLQCESGVSNDVSVKNVAGRMNEFYAVKVWDIEAGAKRCTITEKAFDTVIVGGLMTGVAAYYTDLGHRTRVIADEATRSNNPVVYEMPDVKKTGVMQGHNANGDGLLLAVTSVGGANNTDVTDGLFYRYSTGAVSGNNAGFRYTAAIAYRQWEPYWKSQFRLNTTTNARVWIGWKSVGAEPAGDDDLNAASGFMVGCRAADTTFMNIRNDGTGATVYTATSITKDTGIHIVELFADEINNRFGYDFDESGTITWFTTDIPAQTTGLMPHFGVETTAAEDKQLDRFYQIIRT